MTIGRIVIMVDSRRLQPKKNLIYCSVLVDHFSFVVVGVNATMIRRVNLRALGITLSRLSPLMEDESRR